MAALQESCFFFLLFKKLVSSPYDCRSVLVMPDEIKESRGPTEFDFSWSENKA